MQHDHHLREREREIERDFDLFMITKMASGFVLIPLTILISIASSSSLATTTTTTIPSSPTVSPNFQQLSPEIAPLLPSPGGDRPSSTFPSTIPSSRSPPDPDGLTHPDPAFAPLSSPPHPPLSSSAPPSKFPGILALVSSIVIAAFFSLCSFCGSIFVFASQCPNPIM